MAQFAENGFIHVVKIEGPLMLNAKASAELLGMSTDTFMKIRRQAQLRGIEELCGVELVPGSLMFSRIALVRLSTGEFDLDWPQNFTGLLPKGLHEASTGVEVRRAV